MHEPLLKLISFKYGYLQPYAGSSLYPWPLATPTYIRLNIHIGVHRYMPTDFYVIFYHLIPTMGSESFSLLRDIDRAVYDA